MAFVGAKTIPLEENGYSNFFRISYTGPPPQVPPTRESSSVFRLPTYEEATASADLEDSMRLPNYQGRQLVRFHPYWPPKLVQALKKEELPYQNTIFDDYYVPLEVPARVGPPPSTPPLLPYGLTEHVPDDDPTDGGLSDIDEAEHARRLHDFGVERWTRISRLHTAVLDFAHTLRSGDAPAAGGLAYTLPNHTIQHLSDVTNPFSRGEYTPEDIQPQMSDDSQDSSDDEDMED